MTYFIKSGNKFSISSEAALDIHRALPPSNYIIKYDDRTDKYYLELTNDFTMPSYYHMLA